METRGRESAEGARGPVTDTLPEWATARSQIHMHRDTSDFWYWAVVGTPPGVMACLGCNDRYLERRFLPDLPFHPNDTVILKLDGCPCPHHGGLGVCM